MTGFRVLGGGGGAGAPAGAANFRKDIEAGFAQETTLEMVTEQESGFAVEQFPAILMREQDAGYTVSTFASGTTSTEQDAGFAANTVLTMINLPEKISGVQMQQTWDYVGTKAVATATNIGGDNWTSVTNAQGTPDSSFATRAGQALSSTDGQIRCQMQATGNKDELTIDAVTLRFYVEQTGTVLSNGGLELAWRIGNTGAWTTLATYTGNVDFAPAYDEHDITGSIASWQNIRDVECRVRANLGTGTPLVNCRCDAVELHIEASLLD